MFEWFKTENKYKNLLSRIVTLEVEIDGINKRINNLNLDLQYSKQKKRIVKEEEKTKDIYSSVLLPDG